MKHLPVHERFLSFQGEGVHMGRAAFFIRLFGCPLHCPWCDSAGTWHKDYVPDKVDKFTPAQLVQEVLETEAKFVVITGGEPAIHDLMDLTVLFLSFDIRVHIETSGAFPLKGMFDWVTVSPKRAKAPLPEVLHLANEFKLIIEGKDDIAYWMNNFLDGALLVRAAANKDINEPAVWLHPEWSKRNDPEVLSIISSTVRDRGDPFRAGYQLHKLYRADSLDKRTSPLAPLGGNPKLGY